MSGLGALVKATHAWPDYCRRDTLAKRLNIAAGAVDQLVTRGILPSPLLIGEAKLWRWEDVDNWLQRGQPETVNTDDPYLSGVSRSREAAAPRQTRTQ